MNKAKIESQREKYYLKYKKSSIFDPAPNNTTKNEKYTITDKITHKNYQKKFKPKENIITSRQRYINSLYKNDLTDLTYTPIKKRSKIKRMKSNSSLNKTNNNDASFSHPLTERKEISIKRKISFFRESSLNDEKAIKILRTTRNHRLRSFYSKTSDIFNTHNTSANSVKICKKYEKNKNNENLNKTYDNIRKMKPISLKKDKTRNTKNFFLRELTSKNNKIRSEREKEELLKKKVKEKSFHKKSFAKEEKIKDELLPPMYVYKLKNKNRKTNINNLESVSYNIINNRNSNMREIYSTLSSAKPSFEKVSNYEIIIPNNFKQLNEVKLKNILHAEGLHFFNFTEQGDVIAGNKGKYIFKIRNSNNEKNFKDKIKKVNSKFSKLNVKLKKVDDNYVKKKTDLMSTPKSGKKIRTKK
jgi:hypothetical protein